MTPEPLPLAATSLFRAVMVMAGWRCQCTGQCGITHSRTESRCPRTHGNSTLLMAVPADPSTPERIAAALPAQGLRACCPSCHSASRRAGQHSEPAVQDGLFDI
ncbi:MULTISPECIES: hypothetical protein [Streptomyces]|uniref:hypothetical protein n=1 Tax=Streptomyces TaxID=1883 RepID=UPI000E010318|nr:MULTISPECIES: hypothetical protein [Streptomyces]MBT3076581.1 hypothetical protein [Streptomyces sp. COG21]MBT3078903.1 hypothetical protein [Streptomyces sp. COG20]MBT3087773.1 hypothetical protein [Streptomyces sp. CYG21]MBT3096523.1 hypothetical protein [Streptomyces sp. CBG30]MBT3107230.1 hypothetical protein [Streptomyces sp. COG19]